MEAQDNKTSSIKSCQRSKIKTQYPIELKCLVHPKEKANNVKNALNHISKSHQDFFFWQIGGHGHVVRQNPISRKHLCIHFRKIVASELL